MYNDYFWKYWCFQAGAEAAAQQARERMASCADFLCVKANARFNCAANGYLDDFPGLVHFVHVDRNTNTMIAPGLDDVSDNTNNIFIATIIKT